MTITDFLINFSDEDIQQLSPAAQAYFNRVRDGMTSAAWLSGNLNRTIKGWEAEEARQQGEALDDLGSALAAASPDKQEQAQALINQAREILEM